MSALPHRFSLRRLLGCAALAGLLAGAAGCAATGASRHAGEAGRQVAVPIGETPAPFGYHQYLPARYHEDAQARFPLLVFLHGAGERGDGRAGLAAVLRNGPPRLIAEDAWPAARPFIVLSPQLAKSADGWPVAQVDRFITYALAHYRADPERVYLTGLSLGGHGTWTYAAAHPERLAAAAPVAGNGRLIREQGGSYCALADLPLWAFHGARDDVIAPEGSIAAVQAVRNCPASSQQALSRLTIFPEANHNSWSPTYDPENFPARTDRAYDPYKTVLYDWLLKHSNASS